jgi:hypothetical protein
VQALTIDTTILVSTVFLSAVNGPCLERPLSTGVPRADLMLFWVVFLAHAAMRRKPAEPRCRADIAGIAGGKMTNE